MGRIQPDTPVPGEIFAYHTAMQDGRVLVAAFDKISGGAAYEFNLPGAIACYPDCNADGGVNLSDFGSSRRSSRWAIRTPGDARGKGHRA